MSEIIESDIQSFTRALIWREKMIRPIYRKYLGSLMVLAIGIGFDASLCQAQLQMPVSYLAPDDYSRILIPLSKIPHVISTFGGTWSVGPRIRGFEVDTGGDLYFLGGETESEIVRITQGGQVLYRRVLENHVDREFTGLGIFGRRLVTFDGTRTRPSIQSQRSNTLLILDAASGDTVQLHTLAIDNLDVITLNYVASFLIIRFSGNSFQKVNLEGELIGAVSNEYGLPENRYPPRIVEEYPDRPGYGQLNYVGELESFSLFYDLVGDKPQDSFWFFWIEAESRIIPAKYRIPPQLTEDDLGRPNDGNPNTIWHLRNNLLYYLGSKGDSLEIVTIPIKLLFPELPDDH